MEDIECGQCQRSMEYLLQYPVRGNPTYEFRCYGCGGRAHIQQHQNPQTGQPEFVQIRLTGSPDEYKPDSIRPHSQVQVPVAYTLGNSPQRAQQGQHGMGQIQPPAPAYTLNPQNPHGRMPSPHDPMHPRQLRQRIQPIRLSDFGQ